MPAFSKKGVQTPERPCAEDVRKKIEQTAYELWQKRGCSHGNDWSDWLKAERIVKNQR